MTRKVAVYTVDEDNRDKGRVYVITEMPASQAERWAIRAYQALQRAGVNVEDTVDQGMEGLAIAGFKSLAYLPFYEVEPLMNEMMACVMIRPDPNNPEVVRGLIEDDTEEIKTRLILKMEVLKLHTGFLRAGGA